MKQIDGGAGIDTVIYANVLHRAGEAGGVSYFCTSKLLMADDYSANTSTTGLLLPGGQVKGSYETRLDSDWFKIALQGGSYYRFEISSNNPTYGSPTMACLFTTASATICRR